MEITRRSAFGWPASGGAPADPRKGLVIHYDGSNQGLAGKPHSACVTYWKNTRRFHMGTRGWADIGYSFFACPHGRVLEGRGLNREQAAQPGGNRDYYSVTLASGPSENPTDAQINAVRELRAYLMGRGVAGTVKGHRDFFATACPGDRLYRLVRDGTFTREPEDDMPLTDEDAHKVARAVHYYTMSSLLEGEEGDKRPAHQYLRHAMAGSVEARRVALDNREAIARLAAVQAAQGEVLKALTQITDVDVDMDAVRAAAEEGARVALAESAVAVDITVRDDTQEE